MGSYAFDRENTRQLRVKLNKKTDADILEKIDTIDNIQGYIKQLIRADIAAHGGRGDAPEIEEES